MGNGVARRFIFRTTRGLSLRGRLRAPEGSYREHTFCFHTFGQNGLERSLCSHQTENGCEKENESPATARSCPPSRPTFEKPRGQPCSALKIHLLPGANTSSTVLCQFSQTNSLLQACGVQLLPQTQNFTHAVPSAQICFSQPSLVIPTYLQRPAWLPAPGRQCSLVVTDVSSRNRLGCIPALLLPK